MRSAARRTRTSSSRTGRPWCWAASSATPSTEARRACRSCGRSPCWAGSSSACRPRITTRSCSSSSRRASWPRAWRGCRRRSGCGRSVGKAGEMPLRYLTAGESHGPGLTAVVESFPAGVPIDVEAIDRDLARRMQGYGRGGRMKIEQDQVEIRSGVRWGESLGSPITLWIENRDWRNWEKKMSPWPEDRDPNLAVTRPRPGHADLVGALKYNHRDVRNVLERASARETAARVAVGGVAKCLLTPFGIRVFGWVAEIGGMVAQHAGVTAEEIFTRAEESAVRMADPEAERRIIERIDECKRSGDTLGGVV